MPRVYESVPGYFDRTDEIEENLTRNEELPVAVFARNGFLYLSLSLFTNLRYLYAYKDVVVITFDLRDPRLQVQSAFLYCNYFHPNFQNEVRNCNRFDLYYYEQMKRRI